LCRVDQFRTDFANLESGPEIIMAQLARQPTKAALGLIFCTSVVTTLVTYWYIAHP
jgi:hypothetical protein